LWIGDMARWRGRTDDAIAAYSEYKRLADRLVTLEPDNLKWRMEGFYGTEDIGIALYNKRRFAEAARQFQSALGPMQNLASVDPSNQTYQKELSTVLAWLADAQRSLGNLDAAIALRQRQVSLLDQDAASGALDVKFRQELIPAHQALGILLTSRGQGGRGVVELKLAVDQADRLMPIEPDNTYWKNLSANARLFLADALLSLGRREEAVQQTDSACSLAAGLKGSGAGSKQTSCLMLRSRLVLQSGGSAQALNLAQQALASARAEQNDDPVKDKTHVAAALRLLGDVRQRMGDAGGARQAWSDALGSLPEDVAELPNEMDEHATILERLGRVAEARQIATRLEAMGYRRAT
jgi:tetratricopeptide (TPR) repeat protein